MSRTEAIKMHLEKRMIRWDGDSFASRLIMFVPNCLVDSELTYCLELIHPKHECVRNPLVLSSVCIKYFSMSLTGRSLVIQSYLQRLPTPPPWSLWWLGEHGAWFSQTRILAWKCHLVMVSVVPVIHPPLKMPAASGAPHFFNPKWSLSLERHRLTSQSKMPNTELVHHSWNHTCG